MSRVETLADGVTLDEARKLSRTQRYRMRKRGINVPFIPNGPVGYKQPPEHIEKRKRIGEQHYAWHGETTSVRNGRKRALKLYPVIGPCVDCGAENSERHHVDGNTSNNARANVQFVCRRCHMKKDGRLARFTNGRS
jgi:hypothetical protein